MTTENLSDVFSRRFFIGGLAGVACVAVGHSLAGADWFAAFGPLR